MPTPVIEALQAGKIEYTKARALARVKEPDVLNDLLEQTTTAQWLLTQVRAVVNEKTQSTKPESIELKQRFSQVSKTLKASTVWEDLDKRQRLKQLLDELQQLTKGSA